MINQRPTDIGVLLTDPSRATDLPVGDVPEILCRLGALQAVLAARLARERQPASGQESEALLTIDEAARRLSVSKDWLYRRSRALPFTVRVGRHVRFREHGIDRYIRQREGR